MEIKNSEWTEFAEFIARQSTWPISQYIEDGTYICCPFSTIERAYAAFSIWKTSHSSSEVRKYIDVDYEKFNPEYDALEEFWRQKEEEENEYYAYLQKQEEIEECYAQQYPEFEWPDEADNYMANREKQITRIAQELADKYGELPFAGKQSWKSLGFPFFEKYELNSDEKRLFINEYFAQLYLNCNHHV